MTSLRCLPNIVWCTAEGHPSAAFRSPSTRFRTFQRRLRPVDVRRACPAGFRRQFAFKHFFTLHPDDVRYFLRDTSQRT